jgi:hypothetical protein
MLTDEQLEFKVGKVSGSMMGPLMNAVSEAALVRMWEIAVGLREPDPPNWAMTVGSLMEKPMLDQREKVTGQLITRRGDQVDHPKHHGVMVTLDGYREADDAVVENKFHGCHRPYQDVIAWAAPQATLAALCTGATKAVVITGQGTADPIETEIQITDEYSGVVIERALWMLDHIRRFVPPFPLPPAPPPPEKWRTADIVAEPCNWGQQLLSHLETYGSLAEAAQQYELAGKAARELVPDDVGTCLAGAWQLKRNRKGVLSITRSRQ